MKNLTAEQNAKIQVRLNRDLLEDIRRLSALDNRSINNYLIRLMLADVRKRQKKG